MKRAAPPQHKECSLGLVVSDSSFGTNEQIWDRLTLLGLIEALPRCSSCGAYLNIRLVREKLHFSVRCGHCDEYTKLLAKTQMAGVKKIRAFFHVVVSWVLNKKVSTIYAETGLSCHTWADYRTRLENVVEATIAYLVNEGEMMLGGFRIIVEVDECHLFTPKYGRGEPPKNSAVWIVGLIERDKNGEGRRSAFMLTTDRSAAVLVPFIRAWVKPGSILVSDEWRGYSRALDEFYIRAKVNHKRMFSYFAVVDGMEMKVNTNHIEREWREVRKVLACKATKRYKDEMNKEIFRLMFLAGKPVNEQAYILMKKMAELSTPEKSE